MRRAIGFAGRITNGVLKLKAVEVIAKRLEAMPAIEQKEELFEVLLEVAKQIEDEYVRGRAFTELLEHVRETGKESWRRNIAEQVSQEILRIADRYEASARLVTAACLCADMGFYEYAKSLAAKTVGAYRERAQKVLQEHIECSLLKSEQKECCRGQIETESESPLITLSRALFKEDRTVSSCKEQDLWPPARIPDWLTPDLESAYTAVMQILSFYLLCGKIDMVQTILSACAEYGFAVAVADVLR